MFSDTQLIGWYKEHAHEKETVEKMCKWTGAEAMLSYEQNLSKCEEEKRTVVQLLDSWENPVFAAPEKVRRSVIYDSVLLASRWLSIEK